MSREHIAVFILAENRLFREALTRLLGKKSDFRVVGAQAFASQAVGQIAESAPDVLLCDSSATAFPDLQFIPEVRAAVPGLKVLMIGMEAGEATFLQAVREGVTGYVLKDASAVEVAAAIRAVANDQAVCPPNLCLTLFQYVARERSYNLSFRLNHDYGLTRREQQLVQLIEHGLTNKEIATKLNLSEQTIKNHVHRMLRKLGATDRLAAVELCRRAEAVAS